MGFIDSYKQLEKLCGELLNDDRRISSYIEEMENTPDGSFYVRGWNNDLKQLKHYRWIRNQIVHEPDCTEQNMCESNDVIWLDNFYSRIMNQNDPLALYSKATKACSVTKSTQTHKTKKTIYTYSSQDVNQKKISRKRVGCITFILVALLVVAAVIVIPQYVNLILEMRYGI